MLGDYDLFERYALGAGSFANVRRKPPVTAPEAPPLALTDAPAYVRHWAEQYHLARNAANACLTQADKPTTSPGERLHHLERYAQQVTRRESAVLALLARAR